MARFIFQDFETQSEADLTVVGGLKYNLDPSTRALLWSWGIDVDPIKLWCPDLSDELEPEVWEFVKGKMDAIGECPAEVVEALEHPDTYIVGWNEIFDRAVWQQVVTPDHGWPRIEIEQTLDAMCAAQASNLPGSLEFAGRALGLGQKTVGGKAIMQRFARRQDPLPGSKADIENLMAKGLTREKAIAAAIEAWDLYLTYSVQDTALLRDVWNCTRPLDGTEWQEYWTSERINDRGMLADLDVCRGAVSYREEEALHVAAECERLTGGAINSPTLTKQINEWLYERLPEDLAAGMVKQRDEETGEATRLTGAKDVMTRLLEDIQTSDTPPSDDVTEFVELLQFGRSSSAVKFEKILNQEVDGRLSGSYVFNGAGQTGRYCVAADTLIQTPDGEKAIVDLRIGDKVITHLGRPQPVTAVIYKGREQMYRVTASNGATITATAAHRLMTESGWKRIDECFNTADAGPCSPRQSCTPVSSPYAFDDRDRRTVRRDACDGERDHPRGDTGGRTASLARREPVSVEDGGSQPDVRQEDSRRAHLTSGASRGVERERLHVRTPDHSCESLGLGDIAEASRGAPHRRGQDEQRPGQSGDSDEARSPVSAQADTWTIVPVGEREVWDISVAGDASYIAQGLISHNSSRGVQVHNLPRAYLENELDVLDMVAAGVPIDRLREIGPVSSVLAKLIRPTFIAPPDKTLVWGDWSAIEARVNPWLAKTRDADEAVLAPFRNGDTDPDAADLYVLNAAAIFHISEDVIWERYKNGDKEAKGQRQAGKVACVAEGQPVLTDAGLVPIEDVTLDMKVWDGQSFVPHQGSMFMGYKDVWEYDGLTATLDHIVWTEEAGETRFGEAIRRGYHNVKSGAGRAPIRVGGDHLAGTAVPATEMGGVLCSVSLHGVRGREVHLPRQPAAGEIEGLPALHTAAPDTEMAGPQVDRSEVAMHQPQGPELEILRCTRGRVPVLVGVGSRAMDPEEFGPARGLGDRPHRQLERALRSGEPALGDRASAAIEQARFEARGELGVHPERVAVRVQHGAPETVRRLDKGRNHSAGARRSIRGEEGVAYYRGKVAVYDIANAGPLHRFTVSDCLVHNCLALGFLGSVGALKAMARGYGMRLNDEEARLIVDGWRDRNRWARRFGDKCEEAAFSALSHPLQMYPAGRLTYQFVPGLMGGTLVCFLPDGRPIVYPKAKIKKVEKFGKDVDAITYLNGMGYRALWNGLMVENGTQATAASILRQTLVRVEADEPDVLVGHTHDEVIGEVPTTMAGGFAERLEAAMVAGFDWTEGLPLAAEVSTNWYYTKS